MDTANILRFIRDYNEAHAAADSILYKTDCPASNLTTFKIGGSVDVVAYPYSIASLTALAAFFRDSGVRFMIIGKGSNILFDDHGYRGVVICTSGLGSFTVPTDENDRTITAECGVPLTLLAAAAARSSLSGLEFAYGIPGSVGGAVFMNAGAYGGSVGEHVTASTAFDCKTLELRKIVGAEHAFGYRTSIYSAESLVVLNAVFSLERGNEDEIRTRMEEFMQRRSDKQPLDYPSAGSIFKRSPGHIIAQMIDEAGLKGYSIGGAEVSRKHAGFIINKGGATSDDVKRLIAAVRGRLFELYGVQIELEVVIVGENGDITT